MQKAHGVCRKARAARNKKNRRRPAVFWVCSGSVLDGVDEAADDERHACRYAYRAESDEELGGGLEVSRYEQRADGHREQADEDDHHAVHAAQGFDVDEQDE